MNVCTACVYKRTNKPKREGLNPEMYGICPLLASVEGHSGKGHAIVIGDRSQMFFPPPPSTVFGLSYVVIHRILYFLWPRVMVMKCYCQEATTLECAGGCVQSPQGRRLSEVTCRSARCGQKQNQSKRRKTNPHPSPRDGFTGNQPRPFTPPISGVLPSASPRTGLSARRGLARRKMTVASSLCSGDGGCGEHLFWVCPEGH